VVRRDVIGRLWPQWEGNALAEPIEIAVLGGFVLTLSPLFVRLAWPTRPMPDGALRRRLERIALRVGFRYTDILVWDTGHVMLNACVTGIVPGYRYVLLTDALIDTLAPVEVGAVFGHEIGHINHRHLLFFGFFFIGSLGVLSLLTDLVSVSESLIAQSSWFSGWGTPVLRQFIEPVALLSMLGLYFWVIFGLLSRRFERQADVFGSKVVSCDLQHCPPHTDLDGERLSEPVPAGQPRLCPAGIRIFTDALANVARFNGLERTWRSWRHGSIASRIAFLERLERDPHCEPGFQRNVSRLRLGLGIVLTLAVVLAAVKQSWELFR
jgi:STE24 endopeptidase